MESVAIEPVSKECSLRIQLRGWLVSGSVVAYYGLHLIYLSMMWDRDVSWLVESGVCHADGADLQRSVAETPPDTKTTT